MPPAALLLAAGIAFAQTGPAFEAASVKLADPSRPGMGPLRGGPQTNSPGQLSGATTLKALVLRAYEIKSYQFSGPAWMESERYEIAARIPAGADPHEVAAMLRNLLAGRFHLAAHHETRQLAVYTLAPAKNGPKLKPSMPPAADAASAAGEDGSLPPRAVPKLVRGADGFPELNGGDVPRSYEVVIGGSDGLMYKHWARRETMQQLADRLSSQLNRPVLDRTSLPGTYDFTLAWTVESAGGSIPRTDPPPDEIDFHNTPVLQDAALTLFSALPSQLGLQLKPGKGPVEMLIVDRVEKIPTAN